MPRHGGRVVTARTGVAIALVLALVAAGAIAFAAQRGGGEPSASDGATRPAPTATPTPQTTPRTTPPASPAQPTPTPTPTPTSSPLPGPPPEGIEEIAAQVAALRGLPLGEPVDARLVSSADLGAKFADLAFSELDPDEIAADQRLLSALRLIEPDVDLVAVIDALYREQILGLYVIEEQVLYIGGDDPALSDFEQVTAAHEIVHALQDRAFDLDALLDLPEHESDAALAVRALVEGDATLTQDLWSVTHQSEAARSRAAQEAIRPPSPAFGAAPHYLREAIAFPYREGAAFVNALYAHGGWEAIDAAFADPPTTTRQILHPEAYLAGEGATSVSAAQGPGEGWDAGPTYSFGEFDLRQLLRPLGAQRASELAAGWRGGETSGWQHGADDAVRLALAFGSPEQADAACTASPQWYEAVTVTAEPAGEQALVGDRDAFTWVCDGLEVRWGIGPDPEVARTLADAPSG